MVKIIKIILVTAISFLNYGCGSSLYSTSQQEIIKKCSWIGNITIDGKVDFIVSSEKSSNHMGFAVYNNGKLVRMKQEKVGIYLYFDMQGKVQKTENSGDYCIYEYINKKIHRIRCNQNYTIVDYSYLYHGYMPTCRVYSNSNTFISSNYCFEEPDNMPVEYPGEMQTASDKMLE